MAQIILNFALDATITRIRQAVGKDRKLVNGAGDPRAATLNEVERFAIDFLKNVIVTQERQEQIGSLPPIDPGPD